MEVLIRKACLKDTEKLLDIYSYYIKNTSISFEVSIPSKSDFRNRIKETLHYYPWLVAEVNKTIAGYAYASRHRSRESYQWSVDSTVYISLDYQKKGIATLLYKDLFEILKKQNVKNIFAGITIPNNRSIRFHESFGFYKIGSYKNVGYKMGQWHNVGWWQKELLSITEELPFDLIPFSEMKVKNCSNNDA